MNKLRSLRSAIVIKLVIACGIAQAYAGDFDSILRWRNIGPHRGGRTRAVAGVPSQPNVFYMAPVNGGFLSPPTTAERGNQSLTINRRRLSARLRLRLQIRMSFTPAA